MKIIYSKIFYNEIAKSKQKYGISYCYNNGYMKAKAIFVYPSAFLLTAYLL